MKVAEIMTRNLESISSDSSLNECASKMAEKNVGALPVFDKQANKLIGFVTDRDLVIKGIAKDKTYNDKIADVMTKDVCCIDESADIMEAAKIMKDKNVGRLLVCRGKDNFVGILTAADVVRRTEDPKLALDYIQRVYAQH